MHKTLKKRILLISYYWPPSGGGGVQRWLKMTKYLPEMGFEVVVYTPKDGEFPAEDTSLLKEVHPDIIMLKTHIWEPYSWYKKLTGKKKKDKVYSGFISDKKESFMQKLSVFIRGNFFIPDARKFWIKPSINFLKKYLVDHPVDVIVSTGPPHSMHLIALGVVAKHAIPWIADFRDPWTHIDFYDQLRLTSWADRKHKQLENKVLRTATKVITVSDSWAKDFERLSGRKDIEVITNGYDAADFGSSSQPDKIFSICHIGSMNKDRDPGKLWQAIAEMLRDKEIGDIRIRLIGQVDHQIFASIDAHNLTEMVEHIGFMPHNEVVDEIGKATILLLPINDTPNSAGVIPGKLFEYMGSGRPILGIGPEDGDSALILRHSGAGVMIDRDDLESMKSGLQHLYKTRNNNGNDAKEPKIRAYNREVLAGQYAQVFRELCK